MSTVIQRTIIEVFFVYEQDNIITTGGTVNVNVESQWRDRTAP